MLMPLNTMAFETNYSTTLKYVTSIGKWKHNNKNGFYRFISHSIGSEHAISKLFVQWVTHHVDGETDSEIIKEKEITELRGYEFTVPECNENNKCKNFTLEATESFGYGKNFIFIINVSKFGEYLLEKKAL